ncbi:MAG TPA: hypothetical protein VHO94_04265 [Oscillospiraceae bacterium]|nr:hypothetical protein [Oscillospiraceae bacterium]
MGGIAKFTQAERDAMEKYDAEVDEHKKPNIHIKLPSKSKTDRKIYNRQYYLAKKNAACDCNHKATC